MNSLIIALMLVTSAAPVMLQTDPCPPPLILTAPFPPVPSPAQRRLDLANRWRAEAAQDRLVASLSGHTQQIALEAVANRLEQAAGEMMAAGNL